MKRAFRAETGFNPSGLSKLRTKIVPANSPPFTFIVNVKNLGLDAVVLRNSMPQGTYLVSFTRLQVSITADCLTQFRLARATAGLASNAVDCDVALQ